MSQGRWLEQRVKARMSVSEFARKVGVDRTTVHDWFKQEKLGMRRHLMWAVLDVLGLADVAGEHGHVREPPSVESEADPVRDWSESHAVSMVFKDLITERGANGFIPSRARRPRSDVVEVAIRRIPFFDVKIPASGWLDSGEARTADEADGWTSVGSDVPGDAFALRIFGDCMEPEFPSGAVIIFVPVRPGDHGAQFEPGKAYYFEHSDGKATFKKVFYEPPKQRYRLEPVNPKHKPIYVPEQMLGRMSRAVRMVVEIK